MGKICDNIGGGSQVKANLSFIFINDRDFSYSHIKKTRTRNGCEKIKKNSRTKSVRLNLVKCLLAILKHI